MAASTTSSDAWRLTEVTYTPESALRNPLKLWREMVADLGQSRELAIRLFIRDISATYRQSLLGYAWLVLPPLFTALIWIFLNANDVIRLDDTGMPYAAYVLIGTFLWQGFVESVQTPLKIVTSSQAMLAKINFPREALILAGIGEVVFAFAIRMALLVVILLACGFRFPATLIVAPVGFGALIVLGTSLGVLAIPFGVLYRDLDSGIGMILRIWFFLTPVVYPVPKEWPASLVVSLNPVSSVLALTRDLMTTAEWLHLPATVAVVAGALVMLLLCWILFRLSMPYLIERMSA